MRTRVPDLDLDPRRVVDRRTERRDEVLGRILTLLAILGLCAYVADGLL